MATLLFVLKLIFTSSFFVVFATHELLVTVPYFLSYILVVFDDFQLMAKHAIDYNVLVGLKTLASGWMCIQLHLVLLR